MSDPRFESHDHDIEDDDGDGDGVSLTSIFDERVQANAFGLFQHIMQSLQLIIAYVLSVLYHQLLVW